MSDGGPIRIGEIVGMLTGEADRIKAVQKALVDTGNLKIADPTQMRRALVFDAAADMLFRIEPIQAEVKALLKKRGLGTTMRQAPSEVEAERTADAAEADDR